MFSIKKERDFYLGKSKGKKLLNIKFLGIGGAFDVEEGESSALIETRLGKRFLIDCGYSSYAKLKKLNLISELDRVFITHTHSDHISGLSTLIYDRFYIHNLVTKIECSPAVANYVKQYLDITGHPEGQYTINTENVFIEDEGISIAKIDTTKHHWPSGDYPNSGLIFHFDTGDDHAVLIYSGDINVSILDLMNPVDYPFVYDKPANVFIFHDMTSIDHEDNAHANFNLLSPMMEVFKNVFTYHHGQEDVEKINKVNPKIAFTSLIIQGKDFVVEESRGL